MSKMSRKEFLTPVKTPYFCQYYLYVLTLSKTQLPTMCTKKVFFPVGHQIP